MNHPASISRQSVTAGGRLAYLLATGLGAGFSPVAPGTAGAAEGVAIFLLVEMLRPDRAVLAPALIILNLALFFAGVWSSQQTCKLTGLKDPQIVVIDEISGQLIALTPMALMSATSTMSVIVGFLLFRLFDILKPYPIRKLERLRGGYGVMADDALAGIYAAVAVWICAHFKVL